MPIPPPADLSYVGSRVYGHRNCSNAKSTQRNPAVATGSLLSRDHQWDHVLDLISSDPGIIESGWLFDICASSCLAAGEFVFDTTDLQSYEAIP